MPQVDKLPYDKWDHMPKDHVDNRFINAVLTNDREVLIEMYDKYLPKIIRFIVANSGTEEDAMDIFQDAIMIIYKKAKAQELEINRSFYNYLYTICRNLWLRELEKKRNARVTRTDLELESYMNIADITGLDEVVKEREVHKLYLDKFRELGDDCQNILRQFFAGVSMKAIAKHMGFASEGYAKKRKHVCQKKLIQSIKQDPRFTIHTKDT